MKAEEMQKCIVKIEDWQMKCCGIPFKVGDKVDWIVHKQTELIENSQITVNYYYEHHSSEWQKLLKISGVVGEIKALYYSLELHPNPSENHDCTHHRVYKKTVNVIGADGWDKDIDGLEFGNYIVVLHDCTIRPAEKLDVTFS